MLAQKEKLRHYLSKGNFALKARVARRLIDLLREKEALSDLKVRVDYTATPQGKTLDRPGDIFVTLPSLSFEDATLSTRVHSAILVECLADAQPVAVLTENEEFLQLPFVYSVPVIGKWSKREARGPRESYSLPWCPIDEDGADRSGGRDFSIPLERGVAAIRREFPDSANLTTSLALMDSSDEIAAERLVDCCEVLVTNTLDVFGGLKDLIGRTPMQIDLLMVWPVLVAEKPPLIIKDADKGPDEAGRLVWWSPVDFTGFVATTGIQAPAANFASGAGIFLTVVGVDALGDFVEALDKMFAGISKRFGRLRLQDLYG